jgi:KDO2-lipid IV(A) lauroyltransferase
MDATYLIRRWRLRASRMLNAAIGGLAIGALKLVRLFKPDSSINFAANIMRRLGPLIPEHKLGRSNLQHAFPEKSPAEIEAILREVWANLGRVGAEFAHLDRLWDYNLERPEQGRIEFAPGTIERFFALRDDGKPALVFAAHFGNWELSAIAAAAHGLEAASLYRRPNIRQLDHFIRDVRATNMGTLIASGMDAPSRLAGALERGAHLGILVDQHFSKGVDVEFFGRTCKANSLFARLARQFECPIHGTRIVRLPNNRFRAELTEEIPPVRDADGRIDLAGTTQAITSVIEGWVREHPAQWLWLHRRWR